MVIRVILCQTASAFLRITTILLFAYVIMSWIRPRYPTQSNRWFFQIDAFVRRLIDPMLNPIRNLLPTGGMGIDFSVLILWLLIEFVGYRVLLPFIC